MIFNLRPFHGFTNLPTGAKTYRIDNKMKNNVISRFPDVTSSSCQVDNAIEEK